MVDGELGLVVGGGRGWVREQSDHGGHAYGDFGKNGFDFYPT